MRIATITTVVLIGLLAGGCACRTKQVGPGDGEIPMAEAGKELKDVSVAFDSYEIDTPAKTVLAANTTARPEVLTDSIAASTASTPASQAARIVAGA